MGSENGNWDEQPVHDVILSHFAMGKYEVTVGEFRRFVAATGYQTEAEKDGGVMLVARVAWSNARHSTGSRLDSRKPRIIRWSASVGMTPWPMRVG